MVNQSISILLELHNAEVIATSDRSVRIISGKAWLTDASGQDVLLAQGTHYQGCGLTVIEALDDARIEFGPVRTSATTLRKFFHGV